MNGSCTTCKYWVPLNDTQGTCHRYPPERSYRFPPDGDPEPSRPVMAGDCWCGEHAVPEGGQ